MVDPVLRIPVPLLIGHPKRAVGLDTHPIGRPEATGHDLRRRPVRGDFQKRAMVGHDGRKSVAGGLGVVEIAGGVGLEAHRKLMEMLGHLVIVVDRVVAVDLAVVVEVDKPHDPVAAANMDHPADHFQPQRLKQPRGNPLPFENPLRIEQPRHPPDIAIPGADGGHVAVAPEEIQAGEPQLRVPGICIWGNETIDRKRIVDVAALDPRLEHLRPERPRWLADGRECGLDRRHRVDRHGEPGRRAGREGHRQIERIVAGRDVEHHGAVAGRETGLSDRPAAVHRRDERRRDGVGGEPRRKRRRTGAE